MSRFPPSDEDGEELQIQYRALKAHRREQVYNVPGNHDAPNYDQGPGSWFRKWADPMGETTEFSGVDPIRRPFRVKGTWERYRFRAGNLLFLMLADRNDAPTPVGRCHSGEKMTGGYPPGAATRETFKWWKGPSPETPVDDWVKYFVVGGSWEAPDVEDNVLYDGQGRKTPSCRLPRT